MGLGVSWLSREAVGWQPQECVLQELDEIISGLPGECGPSKAGPQHPITLSTNVCSCPVSPETCYLTQFFLQAVFLPRGIATSLLQLDTFIKKILLFFPIHKNRIKSTTETQRNTNDGLKVHTESSSCMVPEEKSWHRGVVPSLSSPRSSPAQDPAELLTQLKHRQPAGDLLSVFCCIFRAQGKESQGENVEFSPYGWIQNFVS